MKHQISRRDFLKASGASALALSAMGMTGCSSDSSSTSSTSSNGSSSSSDATVDTTYSILYSAQPATLNYLTTGTVAERLVGANCVDTLVEFDNKGALKEGLATDWTWDADSLTWTFNLREAQWIDCYGEYVAEVTAQDFVDSMKYILTPAYASSTASLITAYIVGADEYYDYNVYLACAEAGQVDEDGTTYSVDASGNVVVTTDGAETVYAPVAFEDVGVKAVDDHTLEYSLTYDFAGFISLLVYQTYEPAYGPLLDEMGDMFGTSAETMYYCGAYYLSEYISLESWVMTKNAGNYDADNVKVEALSRKYNSEATTIGPEMIKRGEIDEASIGSDILDAWLADDATKDLVSMDRPSTGYTYFYLFNFAVYAYSNTSVSVSGIDADYAPDNWVKAISNKNFRKSIQCAIDNNLALAVTAPEGYENYKLNTVTPPSFCANADGVDFTECGGLAAIGEMYNEADAQAYRDAAITELTAAGATFPITIQIPYNPSTTDWDKQTIVLKQQLESVLGTDYISCVITEGPSDSFLSDVRREGKYCFLLCNWGADYSDPETETDPFYQEEAMRGSRYCYLRTAVETGIVTGETADTIMEYMTMIEAAKLITSDTNARYEAFADAEALLIENALVIPMGLSVPGYVATKLNYWNGQYASTGFSNSRYKGMTKEDHYITMEEYAANRDAR
ncbi:MAG: ABC transporter substrate-binding protein [Faecalibacterium sp.]